MLLPSALPCEHRPLQSQAGPSTSPLRRSTRSITSPSPYHSPPFEEPSLMIAAPTGLLQTCRRLQQILSVDRSSSPVPSSSTSIFHSSSLSAIRQTTSAVTANPPKTPARRSSNRKVPKTPTVRRNKRTRAVAFPRSSPLSADTDDSDNSDREFEGRFCTPQPTKRPRLTTPPPPPNRGLRRGQVESDNEGNYDDWTDEEDRQLVEMVLGKLKLSMNEWEECARCLGKRDGRTVGRRWEGIVGEVVLKDRGRKRVTRKHRRN